MKEIKEEKRLKRIEEFDKFFKDSNKNFKKFRDEDKNVELFENFYMLCVCPGGRFGGFDKRIVEIFWGARPYDRITTAIEIKYLRETGVTLFFCRNDNGYVTISLHPAKTENMQPIEDSIFIYKRINPNKLNNKKFLYNLWKDFVAYMEVTSLDGSPSLFQRIRIFYYRNFKNLVIKNIWQPTRIYQFSKSLLKWVLTVGLSGLIIYFLTVRNQPDTSEINNHLESLNKELQTISGQLENILR